MTIQLDELQLTRDDSTVAGAVDPRILNGVLKVRQDPDVLTGIVRVYQNGPALQEVAVALQYEVNGGIEQRVSWTDKGGQRFARHAHERLLEGDALITGQHRFSSADQAV